MQKITFEDTQVTKKPYVTINETEYEVKLYDTTLDISKIPEFGDNYKRITRLYGVKL